MTKGVRPRRVNKAARFSVVVVFPTPPLPLETAALVPKNAQTLKWSGQIAIANPVLGLPQQPVWTEAQIDLEAAGFVAAGCDEDAFAPEDR